MNMPKMYVEDQKHRMERKFLSDEAYEQAITGMIIVCTDAVIINRERDTFYLAKRAIKPMQGLWWIGGRRLPSESAHASMQRCFKRETGLHLQYGRFTFVDMAEYVWKDRQQEPQYAGSHNLCHTFAVELTDEELAQAKQGMEKQEYEAGFGLQEFGRADMVHSKVHQVILDLYDKIFPY